MAMIPTSTSAATVASSDAGADGRLVGCGWNISTSRRRFDVLGADHFPSGALKQSGCRLERSGCGNTQLKIQFRRGKDPGVGHVAGAIANKSDDLARHRAALFLDGEDIGQNLTWMLLIGEGVNRRYG